jgi:BASS family bile acid:Na+ symporter
MFSIGLMLGREQIAAAMQRRVVLLAVIFAVVVPVPALAVLALKLFGLSGPIAVGIVLMSISPGAPIALRRALDAGSSREFAPALHVAIVVLAVVTVPASLAILDWIFAKDFTITPFHIGRQVFLAQLLPLMLGAALTGSSSSLAARLEQPIGRLGTYCCDTVTGAHRLPTLIAEVGWIPFAGIAMTVGALAVDPQLRGEMPTCGRPPRSQRAMRNPGLALVIATVNRAPFAVTAAVIGYALGLAGRSSSICNGASGVTNDQPRPKLTFALESSMPPAARLAANRTQSTVFREREHGRSDRKRLPRRETNT